MTLITSSAGGPSEQLQWAMRCGRFASVHHPHLAALVDFGVIGPDDGRRFEVWRAVGPWRGARERASAAVARVQAYLRASDLRLCERPLVMAACEPGGTAADRPVVIPDAAAGREPSAVAPGPLAASGASGTLGPLLPADTIQACGIDELTRPAVQAVIELLGDSERRDPRAFALWGAPGSGLRAATRTIARVARLQGFVPIDTAIADPALWRLVADRSLLLIDRHGDGRGWRRFLEASGARPRSHLLMLTTTAEVARVHSLRLDPVSRDALIEAVSPHAWRVCAASAVARAADAAQGLPARFAAALWRAAATAPRRLSLAAERRPPYGVPAPAPPPTTLAPSVAPSTPVTPATPVKSVPRMTSPTSTASCAGGAAADRPTSGARAWPVSGDVAALRHKLAAVTAPAALPALGARGERELRAIVAALARRRDWRHAARGAAVLAAQCERRGRTRDTERWLAEARPWAEQAADLETLGALTLVGSARELSTGALEEAESMARSALVSARARGDGDQARCAGVALSRALFWQGRYADALDAVRPDLMDHEHPNHEHPAHDSAGESTEVRVALLCAAAEAALGVPGGGALAWAARARAAAEPASADAQAQAAATAALVQLVSGDHEAAGHAAAQAVAAARRARDLRLGLQARVIAAECERRGGRSRDASALVARLARWPRDLLGAPVRAQLMLLREVLAVSTSAPAGSSASAAPSMSATPSMTSPALVAAAMADVAARVAASTGMPALVLLAPAVGNPLVAPTAPSAARAVRIDEVLALLERAQAADDDTMALAGICGALREQLQATAVAVVCHDGTTSRLVAAAGGRFEAAALSSLAQRATTTRQVVRYQPPAGGVEAAASIRCGERTIGAVIARWSPASPLTAGGAGGAHERMAALLSTAAVAAAPALAVAARPEVPSAIGEIVGDSEAIRAVRQAIERAAPVPYPVLVEGESGSGKELVARALHRRGPRRDRPCVAVNCAALPDDLVEAELFGHARGAFTGAMTERPGVFEEAHGGTLFLDEIGELSLRAQAKLLRTLQESEVRRVGENVSRRVDVRVVAATNRDLRHEVAQGRFRLDLLYRLDVVRIAVPPLRERRGDLPLLIDRFWHEATARVDSRATLSAATLAALTAHAWPGNVRELQNVLAALAVRAPRRGVVPPAALPWTAAPTASGRAAAGAPRGHSLEAARRQFEADFVRAAIAEAGGHRGRAAAALGLTRQGLAKLMARLELADAPERRARALGV